MLRPSEYLYISSVTLLSLPAGSHSISILCEVKDPLSSSVGPLLGPWTGLPALEGVSGEEHSGQRAQN